MVYYYIYIYTLYCILCKIYCIYICIYCLCMPFLKMSYLKIKQKGIHKILVIFQLFTNLGKIWHKKLHMRDLL